MIQIKVEEIDKMGIRKMSIQEGLNELKTLDARINKALSAQGQYAVVVTGKRVVRGFESNEKFINKAKAKFDSIQSLIKRRDLIKNAIIKKNAEVEVEIGNQNMTLAEAINKLQLSDRVVNGDLLRFYAPTDFTKVDPSKFNYNEEIDLIEEPVSE